MTLQDYTTEELKAELQRRQKEARKRAAEERRKRGTQYAHVRAKITRISGTAFKNRRYEAKIIEEDLAKLDRASLYHHRNGAEYPLLKANFNSDTAPRIGDIVLLRSRKTNRYPEGFGLFCTPYISEIYKRKNN